MNRRGFLKLLGGATATVAAAASGIAGAFSLDPEKALWVPGAKTIFIPPVRKVVPVQSIVLGDGLLVLTCHVLEFERNLNAYGDRFLGMFDSFEVTGLGAKGSRLTSEDLRGINEKMAREKVGAIRTRLLSNDVAFAHPGQQTFHRDAYSLTWPPFTEVDL